MTDEPSLPSVDGRLTGCVVANHGRHVEVQAPDGRRIQCRLHGRKLLVVCGDRVEWAWEDGSSGIVHEVLPRRSVLERLTMTGRAETVVANLDRIVAVAAARRLGMWRPRGPG